MSKKVFIADDDSAIVEATSLLLEEFDYVVETTLNGKELYALKELPDLILLDIWMSGQDGREICRYLKSTQRTKHIPIIMISASRDIKQSALDAGADDFLEKPYAMDDLISKIEKQLQK